MSAPVIPVPEDFSLPPLTPQNRTWMYTTCVCGKFLHSRADVEVVGLAGGIPAGRCVSCGVIRTTVRPTDYEELYTEGDEYHAGSCQEVYGYTTYYARYAHDQQVAELRIPRYLRLLRSLDVGCANGAFVSAMAARGWDASGLEVNPGMAEWARQETKLPIYTTWQEVLEDRGSFAFDLITYHDVFEHVVDPVQELWRARAALRKDGLLVLDLPDADEVFGPDARAPHHEKPEQHLFYWSEKTLVRLLSANGFIVEEIDRPIVGKLVVSSRKN